MFPFYRRHTVFAHVVGRSSWIFISLLLSDADPEAVVLHRLQSQRQEHLEPKPTSANGCSSKPAFPNSLRHISLRAGT